MKSPMIFIKSPPAPIISTYSGSVIKFGSIKLVNNYSFNLELIDFGMFKALLNKLK